MNSIPFIPTVSPHSIQDLENLNVAFKALLHNDLSSFKTIIKSSKEYINVQFTPLDLPEFMISSGIQIFSLAQIVCWMGKIEFLKVLVKNGARIEDRDPIFGGSCLHWAVFGRQKETALFLVYDLHCDVEAKNKFGQKPVNIFASAVSSQETPWDFLLPEWLTKASKHESPIKIFLRVANYFYVPKNSHLLQEEEAKIKNIVALSHLPSFPKVMEKIHSSRYDENSRGGVHFFLLEVQRLFSEGKAFYSTNRCMKKLISSMEKIFKQEIVSLPSAAKQQPAFKSSIPLNFTVKSTNFKSSERISRVEEFIRDFRITNLDGTQGFCVRSGSFCFSFCNTSAAASSSSYSTCILTAQLRMNSGLKVAVPMLFLNGSRVQTFAVPSEEAFEWNLLCKKGTNTIEVFLFFGKYFEPKTGTLRNVSTTTSNSNNNNNNQQNPGSAELKQLYSHFIQLQ